MTDALEEATRRAFSRAIRLLEAPALPRYQLTTVGIGALLLAWTAWLFLAPVTVTVSSVSARIEVVSAAFPVSVERAGRVLETRLQLDRRVSAGEPLLRLDTRAEELRIQGLLALQVELEAQLQAIGGEIAAATAAEEALRSQARLEAEMARARSREAEAGARLARHEAVTTEALEARQAAPEGLLVRHHAESEARSAASAAAALDADRVRVAFEVRLLDAAARVAELRREEAALRQQKDDHDAEIAVLEHHRSLQRVAAPVGGRVEQLRPLQVGTLLQAGDVVASIVPEGPLQVVAQLRPGEAVGRVREGQRGLLRLHGFPWTQYGSLVTEVTHVADEPWGGNIRVELSVWAPESSSIPIQHGLTGELEIAVEETTPAWLLARSAGLLARRADAATPPPSPGGSMP